MSTQSRQDELVRLLRRRQLTTVQTLSESLAISRRTVLRDIQKLRDLGFDVQTSSGPGGGIYLDPASILVSPKLTSSEVFALLISVAVLRETTSVPFAQLADVGLQKIEGALPRERVLALREILSNVYIGQSREDIPLPEVDPIEASVLPAFEACFLESRRMAFHYSARNGNQTRRHADPHALLVLSPAWYMIGYDTEKNAFRHFRMDRMTKATRTHDHFERRKLTVQQGECPFTTGFL